MIQKVKTFIRCPFRFILYLILASSFIANSYSQEKMGGVDEVGNGAGLYENMTARVWQEIPHVIEKYLDENTSSEKNEYIQKLYFSLFEIQETSKIIYSDDDSLFRLDGKTRIAVTYPFIGADVLINLNRLYQIPVQQFDRRIFSILIHELLHQVGLKEHFQCDKLGNLLAGYLKSNSFILYFNFEEEGFVQVSNFSSGKPVVIKHENNLTTVIETSDTVDHCQDYQLYNPRFINAEKNQVSFDVYLSCKENNDSLIPLVETIDL